MKVKVLLENTKPVGSNLSIEHGLSLLIKKGNHRVLFDTGGTKGYAIKNALIHGEDLSKIDAVVLSHGHNDHTGGLSYFFNLNDNAPVYLKKEALIPLYSKDNLNQKFIGTKIDKEHYKRLIFVDKTVEIIKGILLVPDINERFQLPSSNRNLYFKDNSQYKKDTFLHELFMLIKAEKLSLLTGCGHKGIKNVISTVEEIFPDTKIENVIGGFHLQAGTSNSHQVERETIIDIVRFLKDKDVQKVYTGHCTGIRGFNVMKSFLNGNIERIYSGKEIIL